MIMADNDDNRDFASMDEEKQREIARKGGKSEPKEKRSFCKGSRAGVRGGLQGWRTQPRGRNER
jgi:hypothetical protein